MNSFKGPYYARVAHDAAGCVLHLIAVILLSRTDDKTATHILLIAQECVALAAHLVYCYYHFNKSLDGARNRLKWVEYAFSATLGTLAVMFAAEEPIDWWSLLRHD